MKLDFVIALVKTSLAERALKDFKGSPVLQGSVGGKERLVTQDLQDSMDHKGQV